MSHFCLGYQIDSQREVLFLGEKQWVPNLSAIPASTRRHFALLKAELFSLLFLQGQFKSQHQPWSNDRRKKCFIKCELFGVLIYTTQKLTSSQMMLFDCQGILVVSLRFFFLICKKSGEKTIRFMKAASSSDPSAPRKPETMTMNSQFKYCAIGKKKQERKKCPNRTWLIRPRGFMPFTFSPRTFYTPSSRLHLRPSCSVKWTPQNRRNLEFTLLLLCFIGGRWVVEFRLSYVLWFVSEGLVHGFEILQLGRHLLCLLRGFRRPGYERNGKNE